MEIAITPKPEWETKDWGRTKRVFVGTNFEVHELHVVKGGYCSRHQHRKWNAFHVIDGQLKVELFRENDTGSCEDSPWVDRILEANDEFRVGPEEWHRFVALTDCHLLEIYWTENIDPQDIVRADVGGVLCGE